MSENDLERWCNIRLVSTKPFLGSELGHISYSIVNPFTGVSETHWELDPRIGTKKKILSNKLSELVDTGNRLIRARKLKAFYYLPIELDNKGSPISITTGVAHLGGSVKSGLYYIYIGKSPDLQDRVFRLLYKMPYRRFQSYYRVIDVNTNEEFVVAPGDLDWVREYRVY